MEDLVSIIIPFFNRTKILKNAIFSALNQTYKNKEIILINDGSTESIKDIKEIADNHNEIILHSNKSNFGASVSRNLGIKLAKGRYIAFLDSDDEWLHFKLSYQIKYMLEKKLNFTFTAYLRKDIEKNKINIVKVQRSQIFPLNAFKCDIATPTVVIEKRILENIEFLKEVKYGEDIIFWAEIAKNNKLNGINIPTAVINVKNNSSSNNLRIQEEGFYNINKNLFSKNLIIKFIHIIYFKMILFIKRIIRLKKISFDKLP